MDQTNAKRVIFQMGQKTVILAIQPWLLSTIVTALLFLAVFNVTATFYLFERDDLIASGAARDVAVRQTYEAKFQRYKTAMEIIQNQSSSERVKLAQELANLSERQQLYAARHARVAAVIDNARKMGIQVAAVAAPMPIIKPTATSILADSDISLTGDTTAIGGQRGFGQDTLNPSPNSLDEFEQESHLYDPFEKIRQFEADLNAMEQVSAVSVQAIARAISQEHNSYRAALSDLPVKLKLPSKKDAIGGPFIPADFDEAALKKAAKHIDTSLKDITRLKRMVRTV
ncbi:MAG: hypothetical protein JKY99_03935, partial [Rhizobiales bacterium]|nr:hypothetical protein [Hyphomicrobiales bacterium]